MRCGPRQQGPIGHAPGSSAGDTSRAGAQDGPAGSPFRGPGLLKRATPFAAVAVLAEASVALPPGPSSAGAVAVSVILLLAVPAAFLLPWPRLPAWASVLVPLAYTGSVLALILAAGATSGVGVAILIPLVWTALFHRPWESACIVVAIVAAEITIALTPVVVPDAVIVRRILLWGAMGALISVATHRLRGRVRQSRQEAALLQDHLCEVILLQDRDRIAADLQDKVIQRIFAAGLTLQGAATRTTDGEVRRRIEASAGDLDDVVRLLRDAVFGLEHRRHGHGLRQEVLDMCGGLSPPPEISFTGPVDGTLHPEARLQVLATLREVQTPLPTAGPVRVSPGSAPPSA